MTVTLVLIQMNQKRKMPINLPTMNCGLLILARTNFIEPVSISVLMQLFDRIDTNKYPNIKTNNLILE
ncbi:hypothetical protein MPS01_12510 [Marinilactibacillus psychrotolerans]|uniref:Uncharacterized protein n=1 Tax=Marinilactibacillus psychrotolerans TaxID=191770 RepID=A0AAV3WWW6_9LACT|nr:hypothetical protein MPS01_12510 [Marinilactibacillus psychrotolerans]GEQ36241.1 hypothetical protein M132T_17490 [Marinilactibacillus psychrotolerans]